MMMTNIYNLEDIDIKLNRELEEAQALLKAWQAVTFPTKKDGRPFANMSKNFEGASYKMVSYAMHDFEKALSVYTYTQTCTHYSDSINCYESVKYMNQLDVGRLEKTENIFDGYYIYDLDDIKEEVKRRIAYWQKRIDSLAKQIESEVTAYSKFKAAFETAIQELKDTAGSRTDLFYAVKDSVCEHCICW